MNTEDTKTAPSPPPSPNNNEPSSSLAPNEEAEMRPKKSRKKRHHGETKKKKKEGKDGRKKEKRSKHHAQQMAVQDQMRRALEDDRYSAVGSIVSDSDSDQDEDRPKRSDIRAAMRKRLWTLERRRSSANAAPAAEEPEPPEPAEQASSTGSGTLSSSRKGKKKRKKRKEEGDGGTSSGTSSDEEPAVDATGVNETAEKDVYEEGSIFGPTTGSSHATWVECDKCKKWRRLRGVVDETKLPSRWYCSMNKNDPERARCSAPEEEYSETSKPEEDAADARTRKHLRVWVRRLRGQEAFRDTRRPMTRGGNKRSVTSSYSKEPYEWIRCCACGKWRACLRCMDKAQILDRNSEWYCVMNTWDEKMASCAAPQENLPAIGCPPWVMQDEN